MAAALYNRSPMTTGFAAPLRVRQFSSFGNDTITTSSTSARPDIVAECRAFNGYQACSSSGDFGSCLATKGPDCSCIGGIGYLDCVSAAIATSSCWGVAGVIASPDWDAYERSWYQTACPTPPSSIMAALPQPTTVSISFEPVNIAPPPPTPITSAAAPITQPTYTGEGKLLDHADCKSTSFSLVSADNIIIYAAIVGCMADRPECCPWSVSVEGSSTRTAAEAARVAGLDGSPTSTSTEGNRVAGGAGRFPVPASGVQGLLSQCPDDYYSVSGQCCPNGFYKFTRQIAFQTPCFSSFTERITPPVLTAGLMANPTNTGLPTSAIINVALAMGYGVSDGATPPLSKGAAIGVGVGAGVFAIALVSLTIWVFFRVRRNKRNSAVAPTQEVQHSYHDRDPRTPASVGMTYPQGYSSPPAVSPPGSPPGAGGPGQYGHARQLSDASVSSAGWTKPSPGGQEYGYRGQSGYPLQEYQQPPPPAGHQQPQQGYSQQAYPQRQVSPQQVSPQLSPQGGYGGYYGGK